MFILALGLQTTEKNEGSDKTGNYEQHENGNEDDD